MPNYNYRPNDYMRRGQYNRQAAVMSARVESECDCNNDMRAETRTNTYCMYDLLKDLPIAMAYVPWQEFANLYTVEKAFCQGTLFEELDKPFLGAGGCCK